MLWALIVGLFIGIIAKFLMPGRDPGGIVVTMLLGVAGAALGHWLGANLGIYGPNEPAGIVGSVIGAMILLLLYRVLAGRRRVI